MRRLIVGVNVHLVFVFILVLLVNFKSLNLTIKKITGGIFSSNLQNLNRELCIIITLILPLNRINYVSSLITFYLPLDEQPRCVVQSNTPAHLNNDDSTTTYILENVTIPLSCFLFELNYIVAEVFFFFFKKTTSAS